MKVKSWSGGSRYRCEVGISFGGEANISDSADLCTYYSGPYMGSAVKGFVQAVFSLNDSACVIDGSGTLDDPFVLGDKNNLGE